MLLNILQTAYDKKPLYVLKHKVAKWLIFTFYTPLDTGNLNPVLGNQDVRELYASKACRSTTIALRSSSLFNT